MASFSPKELAIINAYKTQLISDFEAPCGITRYFGRECRIRSNDNWNACGHVLYKSPDHFVDHILWFLHPKSLHLQDKELKKHVSYLLVESLINMCTHCVTILLSKVHFMDIIKFYSITRREWIVNNAELSISWNPMTSITRTGYIQAVNLNLLRCIMHHPKIHRIAIRVCSLNESEFKLGEQRYLNPENLRPPGYRFVHDFDFLCRLFIDKLLWNVKLQDFKESNAGTHPDYFFSRDLIFIELLQRSFKYWSIYHLLFFIKHYLLFMHELWRELINQCESDPEYIITDEYGRFFSFVLFSISSFMENVCKKSMDLGLHRVIRNTSIAEMIYRISNGELKSVQWRDIQQKELLMKHVVCGWTGCGKEKGQIEGGMKVCKQCRMEYYCSRSCQKKAWKDEHRERCKGLQSWYYLDLNPYLKYGDGRL